MTRDYYSGVLQQFPWALYLLSHSKINIDVSKNKLLELSKSGLNFWAHNSNPNGSYNEYYPFEESFPATAFSLNTNAQLAKNLQCKDDFILKAIDKTTIHLLKRKELHASNQEAAAIAALCNANELLNISNFSNIINKRISEFSNNFDSEGWFTEYGGCDFGYLSVTLSHLVQIYETTNKQEILDWILKCHDFISTFILPSGKLGGAFTSRNTEYFLFDSFAWAVTKFKHPSSTLILNVLLKDIDKPIHFLHSLDDRYLLHYCYWSIVKTYDLLSDFKLLTNISTNNNQLIHYPSSGFLIYENKNYKIISNMNKNGSSVWENKNDQKQYFDFGYYQKGENFTLTTNWLSSPTVHLNLQTENPEVKIIGNFFKVNYITMNPIKHILLRTFSYFLGYKLIKFLKNKLIFQKNKSLLEFHRTIKFEKGNPKFFDYFKENLPISKSPYVSHRHVASSNFFSSFERYK